jgi:hypothetical protein
MVIDHVNSDPLVQIPLIPIDRWTGVDASYYFHTSSVKGEASLAIKFEFNSESLLPEPEAGTHPFTQPSEELIPREQFVLDQYKLIAAQLEDTQVHISVYTSIAKELINSEDITRRFLQEFVKKVEAQIQNALGADSPHDIANPSELQPITQSIVLPVPFASILAHPICISPLTISIVFERSGSLICSTPIRESLTCSETSRGVADRDEPVNDHVSQAPLNSGGLDVFARSFETAFAKFDGESGMLKLALATDANHGRVDSKTALPWFVRWSPTAGIFVQLQNSPACFFALKPLSNKLITHSVDEQIYTDIDLDTWANEFLANVQFCLRSINLGANSSADGSGKETRHDRLVSYHRALSEIIPEGLTWLFVTQQRQGDLRDAKQQFTQILLKSLTSAFSGTVAQLPADGNVPDKAESGRSLVPTLRVRVGTPSINSTAHPTASLESPHYAFSDGEINLSPGETWLTFWISVSDMREQAEFEVPLTFQATQVRLDLHPNEELKGSAYSLLKFVLPDESPLVMPVTGSVPPEPIPIALPFYPMPPALVQHSAYGAEPDTLSNKIRPAIEASMKWVYDAQIRYDWAHQDALRLTPIFNLPASDTLQQDMSTKGADENQILSLFEALARSRKAWLSFKDFSPVVVEPSAADSAINESAGDKNQLLDKFIAEAGNVVTAWKNLYKPVHALGNQNPPKGADTSDVCRLLLDSTRKGLLHLFIKTPTGKNPEHWPTIITTDGSARAPEGTAQPTNSPEGWYRRSYDFGTEADLSEMTFRWGPFDLRDMITATFRAQISRNANFRNDVADVVAPEFIYLTPSRQFPRPAIPFIQPDHFQPLQPEETLLSTVEAVIEPLKMIAAGVFNSSFGLQFHASYAYAKNTGDDLTVTIPILLTGNISLAQDGVADQIAREIGRWYREIQPPANNAALRFAITVSLATSNQPLPILRIEEIPIDVSSVPTRWWLPMEVINE